MILQIPFHYEVSGRKKGNLRPSTYTVWETTEIDIRVVSTEDAAVAVTWDDRYPEDLLPDPYARREWGPYNADGNAHTVLFEDEHWLALDESANTWRDEDNTPLAGPFEPFSVDRLLERIVDQGASALFKVKGYDARARRQIEQHGNDGLSMFEAGYTSGRRKKLEELSRLSETLIVVDGRLHTRCCEPKLWIMLGTTSHDRTSSGQSYHVAVVRTDVRQPRIREERVVTPEGRLYFGLGEVEQVLRIASEHHGRYSYTVGNAHNIAAAPAVVDPRGYDQSEHLAARIKEQAGKFQSFMHSKTIGPLPNSTIRSYADFLDGLDTINTPEGIALLENAAVDLHQAFSDRQHPHRDGEGLLARLVTLLESREVDMDIVVDRGWTP